jgi:transcriptional antiterminator RfaH
MTNITHRWCVLYTRPRFENKVVEELKNNGVNCLLPRTRVVREYKTQRRLVEVPLFPSYVFICPGNLNDYYFGLDLKGVLGYVKFGSEIASVNRQTIDNLIMLDEKKCEIELSTEVIAKGEMVMISEGPLTGLSGEMVEYKGRNKVIVRVSLLKSNVLIDIDAQKLKRLSNGFDYPATSNCA